MPFMAIMGGSFNVASPKLEKEFLDNSIQRSDDSESTSTAPKIRRHFLENVLFKVVWSEYVLVAQGLLNILLPTCKRIFNHQLIMKSGVHLSCVS